MEKVIEKKKLSDEVADRRVKRWMICINNALYGGNFVKKKKNVLKAKWMLTVSYE